MVQSNLSENLVFAMMGHVQLDVMLSGKRSGKLFNFHLFGYGLREREKKKKKIVE